MTATAWFRRPRAWVELFAVANLAFLAVDIYVAHSFNGFRHPAEWIPLVFSLVAPLVLVATMAAGRSMEPPSGGFGRSLGLVVGSVPNPFPNKASSSRSVAASGWWQR